LYHIKKFHKKKKQYNEQEVIERQCLFVPAMGIKTLCNVCWKMGINQFSIYASFGSKHGVLESLKCYKTKIFYFRNHKTEQIGETMTKAFFYDSVRMPGIMKVVY
jgi:hypothetical protein